MYLGEMMTWAIMRHLTKEWTVPDDMRVIWDPENSEETLYAEQKFKEYKVQGWLAYSDEPTGRRHIFEFDPKLKRIILLPPLGGG